MKSRTVLKIEIKENFDTKHYISRANPTHLMYVMDMMYQTLLKSGYTKEYVEKVFKEVHSKDNESGK